MQNLKIQTLWQLCQELKQKRQDMIEKLGYTQNYLDQQQTLMTTELLSLRQQNNELSLNLAELFENIEVLRSNIHQRGENGAETVQAQENALLQSELEALRQQYRQLESDFDLLQADFTQSQGVSGQLDELNQDYHALQQQLEQTQEALEAKETQFGMLLQTVQVIQREFDALRQNNQQLEGDFKQLGEQTDYVISLVETYRQAALAAVTDAGMQDEAEAYDVQLGEDAAGDEEDGETKAEAVREAVRKKINSLLRHRFGKLPRKLSSSIKEVGSNQRLDKLFDKALKAESLDEFEASLDA